METELRGTRDEVDKQGQLTQARPIILTVQEFPANVIFIDDENSR